MLLISMKFHLQNSLDFLKVFLISDTPHRGLHQGGGSAALDQESGCWKTLFCAMPHKKTQSWLWENFCDHITLNIWLLNSLDCNPLDYYVWGAVERETKF